MLRKREIKLLAGGHTASTLWSWAGFIFVSFAFASSLLRSSNAKIWAGTATPQQCFLDFITPFNISIQEATLFSLKASTH